jgi:tRNA isopentenyl-2-thiomethyl-A-37 hydroxylase MiaE
VIAGTYRQRHGVHHFWNVRKKLADHTIRFSLLGSQYASVVVQVEDPKAISESLAVSTV